MPNRVMYVQLKTGHDVDRGPQWISNVKFSKSWASAEFKGHTLRRLAGGHDANFFDVENGDEYWISGPKRDQTDGRYSNQPPEIDEDVRDSYDAFLNGAALPGRERG